MKKAKNRWKLKWYNRQGLVREDPFRLLKEAELRQENLRRGGIESQIYDLA